VTAGDDHEEDPMTRESSSVGRASQGDPSAEAPVALREDLASGTTLESKVAAERTHVVAESPAKVAQPKKPRVGAGEMRGLLPATAEERLRKRKQVNKE
jgi:hypothetical protein